MPWNCAVDCVYAVKSLVFLEDFAPQYFQGKFDRSKNRKRKRNYFTFYLIRIVCLNLYIRPRCAWPAAQCKLVQSVVNHGSCVSCACWCLSVLFSPSESLLVRINVRCACANWPTAGRSTSFEIPLTYFVRFLSTHTLNTALLWAHFIRILVWILFAYHTLRKYHIFPLE